MEDFLKYFLEPEPLRRYFVYICSCVSDSQDPITESLVCLLTGNIQFCLNKQSLSIIQGAPALPFSYMSQDQRNFIYEVTSSMRSEVHTYSAFAREQDPLTYRVENDHIIFKAKVSRLDPKVVIDALTSSILRSNHPSSLLFNLIVQRVGCKYKMTPELVDYANKRLCAT